MLYANIAGYARNIIIRNWLLVKIFATLNNKVKNGWCSTDYKLSNFEVYKPRINCGWCCLYTDIAGFTKIMTIVAIDVHYGI